MNWTVEHGAQCKRTNWGFVRSASNQFSRLELAQSPAGTTSPLNHYGFSQQTSSSQTAMTAHFVTVNEMVYSICMLNIDSLSDYQVRESQQWVTLDCICLYKCSLEGDGYHVWGSLECNMSGKSNESFEAWILPIQWYCNAETHSQVTTHHIIWSLFLVFRSSVQLVTR